MPKSKSGTSSRKKTGGKSKSRSGKTPSPRPRTKPPVKNINPVSVLIIMGLVTVLALMINKFVIQRDAPVKQAGKEQKAPHSRTDEREKKKHDSEDAKNKPELHEKREKSIKQQNSDSEESAGTTKEPVRPEQEDVKVYFVKLNEKTDKILLAPVSRKVDKNALLESALKELIKGPNSMEKKRGLLTAVPQGLRVNSVKIKNNAAHIDFNGTINQGANGSVLINRIDQIVYTATQFPGVRSVLLTIDGKPRQTLGPDGLSIGGPLHRRQ